MSASNPAAEPAPSRLVVAIDGPSGSGKSSVSRAVAQRLGVGYLDTGAMYRALTWWCLEQGDDLSDATVMLQRASTLPLELGTDPEEPFVTVDGRRIDAEIREPRVTEAVAPIATNLEVREVLRQLQRTLIEETVERTGGVVAEGRDITTVVAPDADVRVLLTASEEARLARRAAELHGFADQDSVQRTRSQIVDRDAADSTVSAFTEAAEGVSTVDTSDLDFEQSVAAVRRLVDAARHR